MNNRLNMYPGFGACIAPPWRLLRDRKVSGHYKSRIKILTNAPLHFNKQKLVLYACLGTLAASLEY